MNDLEATVKNIRINTLSPQQVELMITSFKRLGWNYEGIWKLNDSHHFAKFIWNFNNGQPIYPKEYPK